MRFASVCSGIEAASVAWLPLGWECAFVSEIAPFPCAVLAHHYPEVVNRGDFTTIGADAGPIDLLVGGTPCQSFSVAGRRAGLDDARGVLAFEFLRLAGRLLPRWFVFENVPGLLSSGEGRHFGAFLGAVARLGYGWAYRTLDAQFFGVAQERHRLFVVGHLGEWRAPAAVLLESSCLRGDSAPSRETGESVTGALDGGSVGGGFDDNDARANKCVVAPVVAGTVVGGSTPRGHRGDDAELVVAQCHGTNVGPMGALRAGNGNETGGVPFVAYALRGVGFDANGEQAYAVQEAQSGVRENDIAGSLRANGPGHDPVGTRVRVGRRVRRLTPRECERLQGFPDDYTLVQYRGKPAKDGPRYQALGNSMAVPVMRWIGERIALYERTVNP